MTKAAAITISKFVRTGQRLTDTSQPLLAGPTRTGLKSALLATAPFLFLLCGSVAHAEIFRVADMVRGTEVSEAQCAERPDSVWAVANGQGVCMRYYLSTAGGGGPAPVVFMSGDKFGHYDRATNTFERAAEFRDVDSRELQGIAQSYSRATGTTAIYLARVGIDGSSGHHGIKDTLLEVNFTNAALDAIKRRHHFVGFNLTGQSGGSTNIGGLLAMRTDIRCAVPGSGRLALPERGRLRNRPLDIVNPVEYAQTIALNERTRIVVLTDPQDEQVPAAHQTPFVEEIRRAGGRIEQFFVQASGAKHHNVKAYTYPAMAECLRGGSSDRIASGLHAVAQAMAAGRRM
jgi:hypothetical protein